MVTYKHQIQSFSRLTLQVLLVVEVGTVPIFEQIQLMTQTISFVNKTEPTQ